jgi:hypothetical protein
LKIPTLAEVVRMTTMSAQTAVCWTGRQQDSCCHSFLTDAQMHSHSDVPILVLSLDPFLDTPDQEHPPV